MASTGWSNTAAISACDFHPVSLADRLTLIQK